MPEFANIPPDDAPRLEPGDDDRLVLVKRDRRYVFDCAPGREATLLVELRGLVADPTSDLNWFDAAVLSHQLGQRMSDRLANAQRARRSA
ncbi:MAG: hypothetical protein AAF800_14090 [Planctomycetota bacterium]